MKMLAQLDMLADLATGKFKRQKDATKCNNNHHDTQGIERIQMDTNGTSGAVDDKSLYPALRQG